MNAHTSAYDNANVRAYAFAKAYGLMRIFLLMKVLLLMQMLMLIIMLMLFLMNVAANTYDIAFANKYLYINSNTFFNFFITAKANAYAIANSPGRNYIRNFYARLFDRCNDHTHTVNDTLLDAIGK